MKTRSVRVTPETDRTIDAFCRQYTRGAPLTLRAIIDLFFADGFEVANERLSRRRWDVAAGPPDHPRPPADTGGRRAKAGRT